MTTLTCTKQEFFGHCGEFWKIFSNKNNSQDGVANAHKCLVLYYLGIQDINDDELESCASMLMCMTNNATARGWHLMTPDLSRDAA